MGPKTNVGALISWDSRTSVGLAVLFVKWFLNAWCSCWTSTWACYHCMHLQKMFYIVGREQKPLLMMLAVLFVKWFLNAWCSCWNSTWACYHCMHLQKMFYIVGQEQKPLLMMPWYEAVPVGKNKLSNMVKEMCEDLQVFGFVFGCFFAVMYKSGMLLRAFGYC